MKRPMYIIHVVRFGCSSSYMRPCKQNKNIWPYGVVGVVYLGITCNTNCMLHATIEIRIALDMDA